MALRQEFSRVAILAALLFALLPGAALAEPRWLIPTPVSSNGGETGAPDVTTFADGGTAVVWTGFAADESTHVYANVRGRSFNWVVGAPDDLEPGGGATLGDARVVALPNGELIAVWRGGADPDYIRWSRRSIGGAWSPSEQLATPCCSGLGDLVASADGSATLMYFDEGSPFTATLPPGADEWEEGEQLGGQAEGFSLATAPDGGVAALWADGCNSVNQCVYAAFKSPGQPWGGDELVNETSDDVSGIALAARPDGGFTAAWAEGGPPGSIRARDRTPGARGTWGDYQTAAELDPDDHAGCRFGEVDCLDLAPAADGRLVAVWQQGAPAPQFRRQLAPVGPAVAASVRSAAGVWGEAELVGDPGIDDIAPKAVFTADGKVAAAWVADNVTRAAWRSVSGSWTTTNIGGQPDDDDPTQHQDVVADAEGNAVTAWLEPSGVKLSGFDGAGPRFKVFSLPATGPVGQALTFSADAGDAWSYTTDLYWDLGDGTRFGVDPSRIQLGARGLTFTHAYSAPGTYAVTVTATDGSNNTTTRSGTVTITPPTVNCGTTDADEDKIGDACDTSDGSKPPVPFKTVSATVVSGEVFIKFPGGAGAASASQAAPKGFTRLQGSAMIPVGATLDTKRGRVRLRSAADTRKRTQSGEFFDGVFKIGQVRKPRGKARKRPIGLITDLTLGGGSFSRCRAEASASARSKRKVRRLWGDGKGSFRTKGRHAAATVRGTRWLVEDRCDGTLVRVRSGRVEVRDLRRARTVLVRAGRTYIARPR